MCGRFVVSVTIEEMLRHLKLAGKISIQTNLNASPSQQLPVIDRGKNLKYMPWGFRPDWAVAKNMRPQINARSETAAHKPFFKNSFGRYHCLIPANGYYEWKEVRGRKQPFFITNENNFMLLAGLYNENGFCLLTQNAEGIAKEVHDRMPVIISPERHAYWLQADEKAALRMIRHIRPDHLHVREVSAPGYI
jgi:putative SOS response-associated peptidase YedK